MSNDSYLDVTYKKLIISARPTSHERTRQPSDSSNCDFIPDAIKHISAFSSNKIAFNRSKINDLDSGGKWLRLSCN